ncbi:hypothetical protein [Microbacterium oxydans]|uniref:hypothetical protein n=1 Tax=Microbacterium oxydans TaxID=82380 RepID=UPI00366F12F9
MAQTPREGGHQLPVVFSSALRSPVPAPSRSRSVLVVGLLSGVALVAALGVVQVTANLGYDDAASRYESSAQTTSAARTQLRAEISELRTAADAAGQIVTGGNQPIAVPEEMHASLIAAVEGGSVAASDADGVVAAGIPALGAKPTWFWELFDTTSELDQRRHDVDELSTALGTAAGDVSSAREAMTESGLAVITTAGAAAPGFEAAHLSARNDAVIALRDAAADANAATAVDQSAAAAYLALQAAAAQVVSTETEELAEKAGPLLNARLEIEAFARSLAPGVLLDFDWAPVVSGAGYNGSMGGYTTWWWGESGRATIAFSNSVAEQWPAVRSRALIAHEVGHAISVKCQSMYDSSTQDSIEKWATAWAISMGYTDDANGVWAYGHPPQNYIDAAAGCR